jgi:hypothetical protein
MYPENYVACGIVVVRGWRLRLTRITHNYALDA